jgi:tetratricopeptide (TPR) repeat protein
MSKNSMGLNMDTLKARKDTSFSTAHTRGILKLADALKKNQKNNLRWNWKYYKDETHISVPLIATYDALRYLFEFYKFSMPSYDEYNKVNLDSIIVSHYNNVSQQMGYKISPPESMIYGVANYFQMQKNFDKAFHFYEMNIANYPQDLDLINYVADQYLEQKNFDRAFKLFEMNIANHPTSLNAYVGMGDFYDAKGDKQKAIEYYTKALTYGDSPDVKAYLEKLKADKK